VGFGPDHTYDVSQLPTAPEFIFTVPAGRNSTIACGFAKPWYLHFAVVLYQLQANGAPDNREICERSNDTPEHSYDRVAPANTNLSYKGVSDGETAPLFIFDIPHDDQSWVISCWWKARDSDPFWHTVPFVSRTQQANDDILTFRKGSQNIYVHCRLG
jgi:hypothetical protein